MSSLEQQFYGSFPDDSARSLIGKNIESVSMVKPGSVEEIPFAVKLAVVLGLSADASQETVRAFVLKQYEAIDKKFPMFPKATMERTADILRIPKNSSLEEILLNYRERYKGLPQAEFWVPPAEDIDLVKLIIKRFILPDDRVQEKIETKPEYKHQVAVVLGLPPDLPKDAIKSFVSGKYRKIVETRAIEIPKPTLERAASILGLQPEDASLKKVIDAYRASKYSRDGKWAPVPDDDAELGLLIARRFGMAKDSGKNTGVDAYL